MSLRLAAAAALALALSVGAEGVVFAQSLPPCSTVLSAVHRNVRTRGGLPAGPAAVSKDLDVDAAWVERCMEIYGRLPAGRPRLSELKREALQEAVEEGGPMAEILRQRRQEEGVLFQNIRERGRPKTLRKKQDEGFDPLGKEFEAGFKPD